MRRYPSELLCQLVSPMPDRPQTGQSGYRIEWPSKAVSGLKQSLYAKLQRSADGVGGGWGAAINSAP